MPIRGKKEKYADLTLKGHKTNFTTEGNQNK